ncbi:dissimilatory sulfite reductase alpha subunit [Helicobacter pylori v225d]|nr:dissimilatory sulfite reductase alpha subunit [Helicobacter pylori v225d]
MGQCFLNEKLFYSLTDVFCSLFGINKQIVGLCYTTC